MQEEKKKKKKDKQKNKKRRRARIDMSGNMRYRHVPCDPLELHLALPYRVLVQGPCAALSPEPWPGFHCAAIWLCDLQPSAAYARIPVPAPKGTPRKGTLRVLSQNQFERHLQVGLRLRPVITLCEIFSSHKCTLISARKREDGSKPKAGPPGFQKVLRADLEGSRPHMKWGTGKKSASSRWLQIAKPDRSAVKARPGLRGQCCARPLNEHAVWQSEVQLKRVAGNMAKRMLPDMSILALIVFLFFACLSSSFLLASSK